MNEKLQPETRLFEVAEPAHRLDKYLSQNMREISRAHIQKLIDEGLVEVNNKLAKASQSLKPGDIIKITLPANRATTPFAIPIPLNIIYEDKDIMVIDKPAGLTVHPAPSHTKDTLVNALLAYCPELAESADSLRPGIVHRLDRDTSGLIIIAKNDTTRDYLMNQFKQRKVTKSYLALVKGRLKPEKGLIEAPIGRHPTNRKRMAVVENGREAKTRYQVIKYIDDYTLLEAMPITGRTHQIRVHLSAIGHPVIGDPVYGVKSPMLNRQFLHANKLGFYLPSGGDYREFISKIPHDLETYLKSLGFCTNTQCKCQ